MSETQQSTANVADTGVAPDEAYTATILNQRENPVLRP